MKSFEIKLIGVAIGVLTLAIHQSFTLEADYADDDLENFEISTIRPIKTLSPEEEALADEARAHIAKTIEKNLVRLMAIVNAQRERQPRQEEDDDEVTPNPNVLPQVAQILGAIFSGSLNITRVVDQTFGLVPNIVRNQVGGLVKLLTGENMNATKNAANAVTPASTEAPTVVTAPATSSPVQVRTAEAEVKPTTNEAVIVESDNTSPKPEVESFALTLANKLQANNASRTKYRIRNRNRFSSTTKRTLLEDDEIERLEEDLRRQARAYEPYVRDQPPSFFANAFRRVFGNVDFNVTEIRSAVPTIFKGARKAFVVLENLGILDASDLLDELGLPDEEDEEEEEE